MILFFNKEDVYIGYSIEGLSKARRILNQEGIKYTCKVINHSGQWFRRGTIRGNIIWNCILKLTILKDLYKN